MEYFFKIVFSLVFLLGATYLLLYLFRPFLAKHLIKKGQLIEVTTQQFIPKVGYVSVLVVSGIKYLVISNANGVAITIMDEEKAPEMTSDEPQK